MLYIKHFLFFIIKIKTIFYQNFIIYLFINYLNIYIIKAINKLFLKDKYFIYLS